MATKKTAVKKKTAKKKSTQGSRSKINGLSVEDRLFFEAYIGEARFRSYKAYQIVHPKAPYDSARSAAPVVLKRIMPVIEKWLEDEGLSDTHLKLKLLSLLNAEETKFFAHEGVVVSRENVEALHIQTEALKLAMKAKGMLSDKSAREIAQIDELIEIELAKLALARQGAASGTPEKAEQPDPGKAKA